MRNALIGVLLLVACGETRRTSPRDEVQGSWISPLTSAQCLVGLTFDDTAYELDTICTLGDGTVGMQAEVGDFDADGDTLAFVARQATCPVSTAAWQVAYSFSAARQLRLSSSSGITVFDPFVPVGGATQAAFGCFDDQLAFTPRALAPVP